MSFVIQQLKSKKVLVIVTQVILLKHSPVKTTLEELSFVCHESRILVVFYGNFLVTASAFNFILTLF